VCARGGRSLATRQPPWQETNCSLARCKLDSKMQAACDGSNPRTEWDLPRRAPITKAWSLPRDLSRSPGGTGAMIVLTDQNVVGASSARSSGIRDEATRLVWPQYGLIMKALMFSL